MGRTKQTARKDGQVHNVAAAKKSFCSRCGTSTRSFRRTALARQSFWENADMCPPCARDENEDSIEKRKLFDKPRGLFVPADRKRPIECIPLTKSSDGELDGCIGYIPVHRRAVAKLLTIYQGAVVEPDDDDPRAEEKTNNRAERIAMHMDNFELDTSDPVMGDVVFTGPDWTGLYDREIQYFTNIGNY